jgi:hypothetical protein
MGAIFMAGRTDSEPPAERQAFPAILASFLFLNVR